MRQMATDNYPAGVSSRDFDFPELPEEYLAVKYKLVVMCGPDEEEVYEAEFFSEESLVGDGLRKADAAIADYQRDELKYLTDLAEDDSDY